MLIDYDMTERNRRNLIDTITTLIDRRLNLCDGCFDLPTFNRDVLPMKMLTCVPLFIAACAFQTLIVTAQETSTPEAPAATENWIQLFNHKNLEGWTPKFTGSELGVNLNDTFRVEDGLLKISYDKWEKFDGEFGHLFYKMPFSKYRLRAEYRFVGKQVAGGPAWAQRNNGFMIHGQTAESMEKDQKFPNSIEVQLLGGLGDGERGTLNICTPGTQVVVDGKLITKHVVRTGGPTFEGEDWVSVEIEVDGANTIKHIVEGKLVFEYAKPQLDDGTLITGGTISIQAETAPIEFRKVELLDLSGK